MSKRGTGGSDPNHEEQYRSIEDSVKRYVDERLQNFSEGGFPSPPSGKGKDSRQMAGRGFSRIDIYFLLILIVLLGVSWQIRHVSLSEQGRRDPGPEPTFTPAPEPTVAVTEQPQDWERFLRDNWQQSAAWFRAIAEAKGLDPGQVSENSKTILMGLAKKLEEHKDLNAQDLKNASSFMLQYVHARWAAETARSEKEKEKNRSNNVVSSDIGEVTTDNLKGVLAWLGLTDKFEGSTKSTDGEVQAAVAIKWITDNQP